MWLILKEPHSRSRCGVRGNIWFGDYISLHMSGRESCSGATPAKKGLRGAGVERRNKGALQLHGSGSDSNIPSQDIVATVFCEPQSRLWRQIFTTSGVLGQNNGACVPLSAHAILVPNAIASSICGAHPWIPPLIPIIIHLRHSSIALHLLGVPQMSVGVSLPSSTSPSSNGGHIGFFTSALALTLKNTTSVDALAHTQKR